MAKDGTNRGGPRIGSGKKKNSLLDKIEKGKEAQIIRIPVEKDPIGVDTPDPDAYLSAKQRNGEELRAGEIYAEIYKWLAARGCDRLVNRQHVQQYAICMARHIQCEEGVTEYGVIASHPTTKSPVISPLVTASLHYLKQANQQWLLIYQTVQENCSVAWTGNTPHEDIMESLLKKKGGGK